MGITSFGGQNATPTERGTPSTVVAINDVKSYFVSYHDENGRLTHAIMHEIGGNFFSAQNLMQAATNESGSLRALNPKIEKQLIKRIKGKQPTSPSVVPSMDTVDVLEATK